MGKRTKGSLLNKCFGSRRTLPRASTLLPSRRTTSTAHILIWITFGQSSIEWSHKAPVSDSLFRSLLLPLWSYSILRGDESAPTASISASINPDAIAPKSNVVPLAVGLTFGLLTLIGIALCTFWLQRRSRRGAIDLLDARATTISPIPLTRFDQRSRWPRESKRTQPTTGSTLSPGASGTAASTTYLTVTELELPPSYESHERTRSVAKPQ